MIKTTTHKHNLPEKEYIKIYYTDNYTILEKRFSAIEYAIPFIELLKKNVDFHLIQVRVVAEVDFKL